MNRAKMLLVVAALVGPAPVAAAPMVLDLNAGNVLARTQSSALIMSTTATFRQLSGTLHFDPVTGACDVDVAFVVKSLQLPNAMIRAQTMSAGFLDPAEYPLEHYVATCQGQTLAGNLTMHGQTHPFDMTLSYGRAGGRLTGIHAAGTLDRYDWGLDGLKLLVGKVIRVTDDISLDGKPPTPS